VASRSNSSLAADCLRRPVAPPSRKPVFRCLAFKIRGRLDKLRPIDVVERVYVEDGIANSFDRARYDRNHAAGQANMKVRGLRSESIPRHARIVGDLQIESAI
jgi:hypothetical protein